MILKDNFSDNPENYARFRPGYPKEVYSYICSHLNHFNRAWDVGTGNGQVAQELVKFFGSVDATDISEEQLKYSFKHPRIKYFVQAAESTNFESGSFDLIICAQAVHWFQFEDFYEQVKRCLKSDGLLVILGYALVRSTNEVNEVIDHFYTEIIGEFWDKERKYLDDHYASIPFPFYELSNPEFEQHYIWSLEHFLGYLRTWSAVKHYKENKQEDPVNLIEEDLRKAFGAKNQIRFPILFRAGKLPGNG